MDEKTLFERIAQEQVKFISLQFTDVFGTVKSVDLPVSKLHEAIDQGIWFDGSSVEGFARIQESDMHLRPDIDTYVILPWTPEEIRRARIICDVELPDGSPYMEDPRGLLKRACAKLAEQGMVFNVGPEPEFFLFRRNGDKMHPVPFDTGRYFDFSADDTAVRVRTKLILALNEIGLDVEVGHHECALGQHEIDFKFADALKTADNIQMMKSTVKAIAAQEGIIASFMPKPVFGENGSGMHCHQSLSASDGKNLFFDPNDEMYLSYMAKYFIAGQLKHAKGMTGILAPCVNSFKRLVPGYEAPVYIGWAQTNRSALIRVPSTAGKEKASRVELRCPDPSCNPYLALTVMLAAGLEGIREKVLPPVPWNNVNVYELSRKERRKNGIEELPGSLKEALLALEEDTLIRSVLGDKLFDSYIRGKWEDWDEYRISVSEWEVDRYLETA
ncbi:MAG TPA: glutamine synthetase family protein [Flexilinea sp.]|mgnify:FL=1|nr:glutamine synthetase family protein [Flexilinea sp.]